MKKTKRFLSMLLALTMTFSVVFIGTGGSVLPVSFAADPPIVPRVADKQAPEGLVFTVPEYIETYGDNYYMRGNNVKAITDAVKFGAIENTSYSISNVELTVTDSTGASTVQMSNYYNSADASAKLYIWSLSGGTVSANATYVKYVVTYTYKYPYNGDTSNMVTASYTSTAVSAIKQASNPATNYTTTSNDNPWATHITRNYHYLYAENSIGLGTETATVNGYVDFSSGTYGTWTSSTAAGVSGYRYDRSGDSASSCDWTFSESGCQTGVYYVDVDANPNLSTAGIRLVLANHAETDKDHPFTV
ncbi:MAG: hypothetical protein IJO77_08520, partial [Oscillospiraceae bacterium]|nr:hypothetical protein [Oscillospiraceae bacterium]